MRKRITVGTVLLVALVALVPLALYLSLPTAQPTMPGLDPTTRQALDYLRSPERVDQFESFVPKAGPVIARALEDGRFGSTKRYDDSKQDLTPGYVGWGGISSQDNSQFAWVFWNDGKIDYTKPIRQVAMTHASGNDATTVMMLEPTSNDNTDTIGSYWSVFRNTTAGTQVTDLMEIEFPDIHSNTTAEPTTAPETHRFISPRTLLDLRLLDEQAFAQARANMDSLFGPDWDN